MRTLCASHADLEAASAAAQDHLHRDDSVRPYDYRDAESLLEDFWRQVDAALKTRGIE